MNFFRGLFVSKPLLFIHSKSFATGGSGLALRTLLAFRALAATRGDRVCCLAAPDTAQERALAQMHGWDFFPLTSYEARYPGLFRAPLRLGLFWGAGFSSACRRVLLSMLGGSDLPADVLDPLFARYPGSEVWLARCDLLHLAASVPPACRIVLDSNDAVANLVRCYDPRARVRRLSGRSLASVAAMIEREELALAGRCSRIIAISADDLDYYRRSTCSDVVLEESCLTTPPATAADGTCDVGFIGGNHLGSVQAGRNLLRLAARPDLADVRFVVAGSVCEGLADVALPANVTLRGRVASAPAFLTGCRQVVFWSERETGTSVKFQEAILSGTTVLANPPAARWSKALPDRDFLLCLNEAELVAHLRARTVLVPSPLLQACSVDAITRRFNGLLTQPALK